MNHRSFVGITIFLTGAVTMAYEIAGSRVLGPYLGTSVFVWTSLIGIIMGSLSLGYWAGGRLSVSKAEYKWLAIILAAGALFVIITALANGYILERLPKYFPGLRLRTFVAALLLFAPASIFLGMILPYAVKIMISELQKSGSVVGNLYALSTAGSIAGTFAAGFYLIPQFGFLNVLFSLSVLLLLLAMVFIILAKTMKLMAIPVLLMFLSLYFWIQINNRALHYLDVDTAYNRVLIYNTTDKATGRPVKILKVNNETSSAMFTDTDSGLVFDVLKYYHLVEHFVPHFKKCLMIGGSGYAFPKDYLKKYPQAEIDVVEIDPGLTALAKEEFNLPDDPRLKVIHEDGRTFLNRNKAKYDAVFMDAYKSILTIPFQLTTREAVLDIYQSLNENGAVFANIISALDEGRDEFLQAETATYRSVFPHVMLFAVQYPDPDEKQKSYFQNIMLVGLKSSKQPELNNRDSVLNSYLHHQIKINIDSDIPILTDEFAPVEYLSSKNIE